MTGPFYGKEIDVAGQKAYINKLLKKYKKQPANDELRKVIYEELMHEKFIGNVIVPFEVVLRKDPSGGSQDYVEVVLDSKV